MKKVIISLLIISGLISGCGQSGRLYLPTPTNTAENNESNPPT